jgi:uncharacterized metal-binding protein
MTQSCSCRETTRLIFACSGSADVGEVADRAARKLTYIGVGEMSCLAGVGGGIADILQQTRAARALLVIDGCPSACASASLKQAGIKNFPYIQLADLGLKKGESPASPEKIERVVIVRRQ